MTDKEYRDVAKRWTKVFKCWAGILSLSDFKIGTNFHREAFDQHEDGSRTQACTNSNWQYGEAFIHVDAGACVELDDEDFEELVIHELLHIKMSVVPKEELECSPAEERLTTELARAFQRARWNK